MTPTSVNSYADLYASATVVANDAPEPDVACADSEVTVSPVEVEPERVQVTAEPAMMRQVAHSAPETVAEPEGCTDLAVPHAADTTALLGPAMRLRASLGRRPRTLAYEADPYGATLLHATELRQVPLVQPTATGAFLAAVRQRYYDETVTRAVEAGVESIVHVGAGLDTKAFRLPFANQSTLYEIDLPSVVDFKEQVLHEAGAVPMLRRVVIPAGPGDDWSQMLRAAGYKPDRPSLWVLEALDLCDADGDPGHVLQTLWGVVAPTSLICGEAKGSRGNPRRVGERILPNASEVRVTARAEIARRLRRAMPPGSDGWFLSITR